MKGDEERWNGDKKSNEVYWYSGHYNKSWT